MRGSIEQTIYRARLSPRRERLFVIAGDSSARNEYYLKLQMVGALHQRGGMRSVSLSDSRQLKILKRLAQERKIQMQEILNVQLPRGAGFGWKMKNGLGLKHRVHVVILGDIPTIQAKIEELSAFTRTKGNEFDSYMRNAKEIIKQDLLARQRAA